LRRHNLRVFLFLFLLTALAGLVIGYRDIDLPGDELDRGGTGPLGLVLGLDLRGGAHLVYQAQRPVKLDITFAEPADEADLRQAITEMGLGGASITSFTKQNFVIELPTLTPDGVDSFMQELQSQTSTITASTPTWEDRTRVVLQAKAEPNNDRIREAAAGLGYNDAQVQTVASQFFAITQLPRDINTDGENALKAALEQLYPVQTFQLVDSTANTDQKEAYIIFQPIPVEGTIQSTLQELQHTRAPVLTEDGRTFTTAIEALDQAGQAKLVTDVKEKMPAIEEVTTSIAEAAILDLTFQTGVDQGTLETVLTDLGFDNALVVSAKGTNYTVDLGALAPERDLTIEGEIASKVAPIAAGGFTLQRDEPTSERMDGVIDTIERRVDAFGVTEPVVQRLGDDRVIVQLPGVEDTHIEAGFASAVSETALEDKLRELGFTKSSVESIPGSAIPNSALIIASGLTEETSERVRTALTERFGALQNYSFNLAGSSIQVVFGQAVATTDLRTLLAEQGLTNPVINQAQSTSFRIRVPTQTASEQEKLRTDLGAAFGLISGFTITGGVEQAKQLIGQTAQLVIKERTCLDLNCTQFTDREAVGDSGEQLTGDRLVSVFPGTHPTTGAPIVNFVFDGTGTRIFRDLTTRISGDETKCVAHVLDGESIVCPVVRQAITNGRGFIEGQDFTFDRVRTLSIQLQSGSLPVSLELVRETTVESIVGDETLKASLEAGVLGLALVAAYMIVYYRMAGLMASAALVVYAIMAIAIFKMVPITLTLSGIAGIILSIGMAVDANIVIFERLKEELRAGRSLLSAMEIGFRRGWPAIRDGNIATFISCAILFFFGRELGEPKITGFAITLGIGTALSMFTAITITRNFMNLMVFTPMGRKLNLFTPESLERPAAVPVPQGGER
jgi:protein-export membrane protein SecD